MAFVSSQSSFGWAANSNVMNFIDNLRVLCKHATATEARLENNGLLWFVEFLFNGERTAWLPLPSHLQDLDVTDRPEMVEYIQSVMEEHGFVYFQAEHLWLTHTHIMRKLREADEFQASVNRLKR